MEVPSLARSWKLQEHVWETGSVLAPGTSLRLEVTLLAACLRGHQPESESLSWLCLRSMWTEALWFLRTQIGNCRIWSDWKCNGLLHLVVLLMDQKRLSGSFCLNSLDILFVESLEINWRIGPSSLRTKITFSSLENPFAIIYIGVVTLRRDILVVVYPVMIHHFYCGQDCTQECAQAHVRWMLPLVVLAWETFWENYSAPPRVASEEKDKSKTGLGGTELSQFEMPSGLPPAYRHPALVVEPGGTSLVPVSVRDRPVRPGKEGGKSVYTPI